MSTVNVTTGSTSGGGDKPPNNDKTTPKRKDVEPIPVSDEQKALKDNDNFQKATKQSLMDAVEAAVKNHSKLKAELTKTELEAKLLRPQINQKIAAGNKLRIKQTEANNEENAREAAALSDINVKWQKNRMLATTSADTPLQNRQLYDRAVGENTRQAAIATALTMQYTAEIATLTSEREELQASLKMAEMRLISLTRQLAEAETVREERREELTAFNAIEQVERLQQRDALAASQQQHEPTQQSDSQKSQQSSSRNDPMSTTQQLPSPQHQPPPQQLSDVQQTTAGPNASISTDRRTIYSRSNKCSS